MKYLSYLLILVSFILQSCSTENSVSPDLDNSIINNSRTWLNTSDAVSLEKVVTVVSQVNGSTGAYLEYDLKVGNIYINGNLTVPENSFSGDMDFSAVFSNKTTTQTFSPSPFSFDVPLVLNLEYRGVNLKGVNPEEIDFYYINSDGHFFKAEYSSIVVDVSEGILRVNGAVIDHFSRYGWAK